MKNLNRLAGACFSVALLAACGNPGSTSQSVPSSALPMERQAARVANAGKTGPMLYVLSAGGSDIVVSVYGHRGATYLKSIDLGQLGDNDNVAFAADPEGRLYTTIDRFKQPPSILTVYRRGGTRVIRKLKQQPEFLGLTFDRLGNLFTACRLAACEYASGKQQLILKIPAAEFPFATDHQRDFAAAYYGDTQINVFAAGKSQPYWQTKEGTNYTLDALAFDLSGNLYAANESSPQGGNGSVVVYGPRDTSPALTITDGIDSPAALAIDPSGNLNVLNALSLAIYKPAQAHPIRTITKGIRASTWFLHVNQSGQPLGIDSEGYIYVANQGNLGSGPPDPGSVTVYAPGGSSPIRTITTGIQNPVALAVAP